MRFLALSADHLQHAPDSLRIPGLRAVLRHVLPRLPSVRARARVHAAAGPAADCRLYARALAGPLRRREHPAGQRRRFRLGRRRLCQRHAHPGAADSRHRPPRQGCRQGDRARRAVGVERAGSVPGIRLPPHRRDRRRHGPADRPPRRGLRARRPSRCASKPQSACRSPTFRCRPIISSGSTAICSARCNSPAAVPIAASSATSRRCTAGSRG